MCLFSPLLHGLTVSQALCEAVTKQPFLSPSGLCSIGGGRHWTHDGGVAKGHIAPECMVGCERTERATLRMGSIVGTGRSGEAALRKWQRVSVQAGKTAWTQALRWGEPGPWVSGRRPVWPWNMSWGLAVLSEVGYAIRGQSASFLPTWTVWGLCAS